MKKILFLTGTRADFGKLKALIKAVHEADDFIAQIYVTGMHCLPEYGLTKNEVFKLNIPNTFYFINQRARAPMDEALASTIVGLSRHVAIDRPDLLVVHGDRVEALAAAIVGLLNNIRVAHIEGGEISGTVDESMRHAITKLAHVHFTSNEPSKKRLLQLGELDESVFVIGSPEMDLMVSPDLPDLQTVKAYYNIPFDEYAVFIWHPVVTSLNSMKEMTDEVVAAVEMSNVNFVMIQPNNDAGADVINETLNRLADNSRIRSFPSLRFEAFLVLLRNSLFILGNSSCGVREAPFLSVPTINIGTRQQGRFSHKTILNVTEHRQEILDAIARIPTIPRESSRHFGDGKSSQRFLQILREKTFWTLDIQKRFQDL